MSEDSSISQYNQSFIQGKDLPIFLWPKWLETVTPKAELHFLHASNDADKTVHLPVRKTKKYGLSILSLPALTPFTGLLFSKNCLQEEKLSLMKKLLENIDTHLCQLSFDKSFDFADLFISNDFRANYKISYQIDTSLSEEQLLANLKSNVRNRVNSLMSNFEFKFHDSTEEFNHLNQLTYKRQGLALPYSKELITHLHQAFNSSSNSHILIAKDHSGNAHAGLFLVNDSSTMYCLAIGSNPSYKSQHAISLLIWKAILFARENALIFDFEGSSIERVESFFRSFGGKQTRLQQLTRVSNPYLDFALKRFYKIS